MVLKLGNYLVLASLLLVDCGGAAKPPDPRVASLASESDLTVVEFFSITCPIQRAHDARLKALAESYGTRGVRFVIVDVERASTQEMDDAETRSRAYPTSIRHDDGGLADALDAEFTTFVVVLDRRGQIRYRGGIDSDRLKLTDDATPYLKEALDDLLSGKSPRTPVTKAFGCSLAR